MSILLSHSVDQSTIRNDRLNKNRIYNDTVKPNLKHDSKRIHSDAKSTDSKTQEVEMTDVTLSPTRNNETRRSTNDSAISFVNDQTNTELQDNENLLPSAITDEVLHQNNRIKFLLSTYKRVVFFKLINIRYT